MPDASAARHYPEILADNVTRLRTGSQWVILDQRFATYLVRDERAARWVRTFSRRFLSDEAFIQTVLMDSPFSETLINQNMRYIWWPHFDGDPTSYWARMGFSYVGGPQVINASGMPHVLRSPYMFARKVDPTVDAAAVTIWDDWIAKKLNGVRRADQETLGGTPRSGRAGDSLERSAVRGADSGGGPALARAPTRRVHRIVFEDGSSCDCSPSCAAAGICCEDWMELCDQGRPADGAADGGDGEMPLASCPTPAHPPLESTSTDGGRRIRLTFLNHARYPVRIFYRYTKGNGEEKEMGTLRGRGLALTFETRTAHAWVVKTWSGITLLEVPPSETRSTATIDVHECDLRAFRPPGLSGAAEGADRTTRAPGPSLHDGWR